LVIAEFIDVLASLQSGVTGFIVTGGAAVVLHGHLREIADLDVIVDPAPEQCDGAANALMRAGFFPTIPLPLSSVVVMTFLDQRGRRVDVHVRSLIPFAELSKRSRKVAVGEVAVPLIALEDLIEMKRRTRSDDPDIGPLLALSSVR
jgi:hypothetical protein